jgi:hypothetical protein
MDHVKLRAIPNTTRLSTPGSQGPAGPDGWAVPIQRADIEGDVTLDYRNGKTAELTVTGDTNIAFDPAGWPNDGYLARFTLKFFNPGNYLVNFVDDNLFWAGDVPTFIIGRSMLAFSATDGGEEVWGHLIGIDYQQKG